MSGADAKQLVVYACGLFLLLVSRVGQAQTLRIWPGEFAAIARILHDSKRSIEDRRAALFRMSQIEDPRLAEHLQFVLAQRDTGLRQAGLEFCANNEILSCIPQAKKIFRGNSSPLTKVSALNVIALIPDRLAFLSLGSALSDSNDLVRSHAALLIGDTYWPESLLDPMRHELMIKLGDTSARVRRKLAEAIGKLGPKRNSPVALALTPLLEDPDPEVRFIAAHSLGQLQDPRVIPALIRSIEGDPDTDQAKIALTALAKMEGNEIDQMLQEILHRSGFRFSLEQRVLAIGTRVHPHPSLLEDIARNLTVPNFDNEDLKAAVFKVLLMQGQKGLDALRSFADDGLSTALQIEANHILAARPVIAMRRHVAKKPQAPIPMNVAMQRMSNPFHRSLETIRLAITWPSWLDRVILASINTSYSPQSVAPWLALSKHIEHPQFRLNRRAILRLFQLANDLNLPFEIRCHSIRTLALSVVENRRFRKQRIDWMAYFNQNHDFDIRQCSVQTTGIQFDRHPIDNSPASKMRSKT